MIPERIKTGEFLHKLLKAKDLTSFLENNEEHLQTTVFHHYINELCRKTDTIPEQVIKRTTIERTYGHQLFNGTRKPSRDKVLQLAFGFGLEVDEAQKLLTVAQKSLLYPRIKRDAVLLFCLQNHRSELEAQDMLAEFKLTLLGGLKDG
jgi:transcriptional regulator with XRE-family HTH domain